MACAGTTLALQEKRTVCCGRLTRPTAGTTFRPNSCTPRITTTLLPAWRLPTMSQARGRPLFVADGDCSMTPIRPTYSLAICRGIVFSVPVRPIQARGRKRSRQEAQDQSLRERRCTQDLEPREIFFR